MARCGSRAAVVLLTPDEMAQADRLTIDNGVPGIDLMERAGQAVARSARELVQQGARILVLCGPGNNGGDGFIAARCLAAAGYGVEVLLLKDPVGLKGDAKLAFDRMNLPYRVVCEEDGGTELLREQLRGTSLVIDALFGAGLDRPLSGNGLALAREINRAGSRVLSVDLPSGLNGATGVDLGEAIKATASVTFFRLKPGHLLYPGRALCGRTTVADIGIEVSALDNIAPDTYQNDPKLWLEDCPQPDRTGHKFGKGHALVFGGPMSSTGAARLSATAALRAGAGLVTLASPPDALLVNASHLTAVMLTKAAGSEAIPDLLDDKRLNAVLIGPGFGIGEETRLAVAAILREKRASVLDADALTSFSECPQTLFDLIKSAESQVILTPHEGEFLRLFADLKGDKIFRARQAAERSGATVVLKGADTVIAAPDGRAAINTNAPPWLATAGSGDVLAGIALGALAQGVPAFEAACQAVWLHGEAGSEAGPGLIAEDLPGALRPALAKLVDKCQGS